jgi:hypothetical protein
LFWKRTKKKITNKIFSKPIKNRIHSNIYIFTNNIHRREFAKNTNSKFTFRFIDQIFPKKWT